MEYPKEVAVEEVKIHSGTRVKLKRIAEEAISGEFLERLREFAHKAEEIEAVYVFAIQAENEPEHPAMAIALRDRWLRKKDEEFLRLVDEIQLLLPQDLSLNLYRFGASELIARFCLQSVEPTYLRSSEWETKQKKKLGA